MQFYLPNKELWAKSVKYQPLQFSDCRFALSWSNFESNHERLAILWKSSLQHEGRRGIEQNRRVLRFFDQVYLQQWSCVWQRHTLTSCPR